MVAVQPRSQRSQVKHVPRGGVIESPVLGDRVPTFSIAEVGTLGGDGDNAVVVYIVGFCPHLSLPARRFQTLYVLSLQILLEIGGEGRDGGDNAVGQRIVECPHLG